MERKTSTGAVDIVNTTTTTTITTGSSPSSHISPSLKSTLLICRNKHWRYISSYHGPWLQLPPEILQSLALSNYASPLPRPIDPAVFFDLVKVRHLVEEATNLAVRAANGTTSSSLNNHANNAFLGGGGATALGLGMGGGVTAKLSGERKHRMRELATQKLSEAYYLDEIAASVATMQSTSSLEEVARLVLQRNSRDIDAKYVHFFHEKIPSRTLSQCTSLDALSEVIHDRPTDAAPLRTRAVTRTFKDDYQGAIRDLTEALAVCRWAAGQHKIDIGKPQSSNVQGSAERRQTKADGWRYNTSINDIDLPRSIEPQLLFHRAGAYLTLACRQIHVILDCLSTPARELNNALLAQTTPDPPSPNGQAQQTAIEGKKLIKSYAKRALRDYLGFLSGLDYTPGSPGVVAEGLFRKVHTASSNSMPNRTSPTSRLLDMSGNTGLSTGNLSDALIPTYRQDSSKTDDPRLSLAVDSVELTGAPVIHKVSALFSPTPVNDLPPYPEASQAVAKCGATAPRFEERYEAVTYHPLLTEALHSVLLCHSLIQCSPKEQLRHAHMVARLVRVCDGYPIFLAARSPARADWIEVIRRANNWMGLQQSWETLCAPAPSPGQAFHAKKPETEDEARERRRQEAIMEALADERVHDEASFRAAVTARERRAEEERKGATGQEDDGPKRWAQDDGKEYPIGTERAEAIARWVREASKVTEGGKASKRKSRGKARAKGTTINAM